jgi:hypothetical protein
LHIHRDLLIFVALLALLLVGYVHEQSAETSAFTFTFGVVFTRCALAFCHFAGGHAFHGCKGVFVFGEDAFRT